MSTPGARRRPLAGAALFLLGLALVLLSAIPCLGSCVPTFPDAEAQVEGAYLYRMLAAGVVAFGTGWALIQLGERLWKGPPAGGEGPGPDPG